MQEDILKICDLNKEFSNVRVLKDVNLTLKKGSILGLVGENGAGKSTMMNILGGVYKRTSGEILLNGKPYTPNNPMDAEKAGIAFIHQELNLFTNLSVAENMLLDNATRSKAGFFSYKTINWEAKKVLGGLKIDIAINVKEKIENLSMGLRQIVEISKAITKDAVIIIFDEPTTSLSSREKQKLFDIIHEMSKNGISMIYISHTLEDIVYLCDEVAVLRDGQIVGQKLIKDITKQEMITMMVGYEMEKLFPYVKKTVSSEVLRIENFNRGKIFKDISLSMRCGEIVGVYGLMGAGRSELARAIFGLDPIDSGIVYLDGQIVRELNPINWIDKGIAFVTENRREEGLLLPKTVEENLVLANLNKMKIKFGAMDSKRAFEDSERLVEQLNIKTANKSRQIVQVLSGGNQQKVVIGKWLLKKPRVFILDEPTRGVDVGAKYEIYRYINEMAQDGVAILFISSEMEELMGMCDRIVVMSQGRIVDELRREEFEKEKILKSAIGAVI